MTVACGRRVAAAVVVVALEMPTVAAVVEVGIATGSA